MHFLSEIKIKVMAGNLIELGINFKEAQKGEEYMLMFDFIKFNMF